MYNLLTTKLLNLKVYSRNLEKSKILKLTIFIIYEIYVFVNLQNHSMWRDEIHVWLVNKESKNISELLSNFYFDGKPLLYYLITWPISHYTNTPESLKFVTFFLVTLSALIIVWKLKILLMYRIMILLGFLFTGGYSTISRDYILLVFLLLLFVHLLSDKNNFKNQIFLLALLPHVNVFGLIISFFFFVLLLTQDKIKYKLILKNLPFYLIVFSSQILSIIFYKPKVNSHWAVEIFFDPAVDFFKFAQAWQTSIFPWIFEINMINNLFILISFVFLFFILFIFSKINLILFFAMILTFILFIFLFTKTPAVFWWHRGTLTVFLIAILIYVLSDNSIFKNKLIPNILMLTILIGQIFGNFIGFGKSIFSIAPYSNAKWASQYLQVRCDQNCVVIVNYDWAGASISGYLGGRQVYKVDRQAFGTFTIWEKGLRPVGWGEIEIEATKFENFIIVLNEKSDPPQGFSLVKSFEGAVWSDENFFIYEKLPILESK